MILMKKKSTKINNEFNGEIKLENVSLKLGKKTILDQVSLKFEKNRVTALVGENGAGKSMLIKVLIKAIKPTEGQIIFSGLDEEFKSKDFITYIPEKMDFPVEMTVLKFFQHILSFENVSDEEYNNRIYDALKFFNIEDRIDEKISQLSMGLKKKVMLSQIFLQNRQIIILDEPTANIDAKSRKQYLKYFKTLANDEKIVIIVSHILDEFEESVNHCIFIHKGTILGEIDCAKNNINIEEYYASLLSKTTSK